jgi:hypothetical protein
VAPAEALGACGFLRLPFDLETLWSLVARTAAAGAPGPVDGPPAAPAKHHREAVVEGQRRRLLERLAREVAEVRSAAVRARAEFLALAAREAAGRLSREEAARIAVLRRECEALRLRLRECAGEYERLRRRDDRGR